MINKFVEFTLYDCVKNQDGPKVHIAIDKIVGWQPHYKNPNITLIEIVNETQFNVACCYDVATSKILSRANSVEMNSIPLLLGALGHQGTGD